MTKEPANTEPEVRRGITDRVLDKAVSWLNNVDRKKVKSRVEKAIKKNPDASKEELCEYLIKRKCYKAAAVGAITSGPSVIPGLGTITAVMFGATVDMKLTYTLQAELVLEISQVMEARMTPVKERQAVFMVTAVSLGANKVFSETGKRIAAKASQHLAEKSIAKAIPVFGMGASAGVNMVSTHTIGRRAMAYFALGPEQLESWGESTRALTGVDERKLISWMGETGERTWELAGQGAAGASNKVISIGKNTGDLIVEGADKAGTAVANAGRAVASGVSSAGKSVAGLGRKTGSSISKGAGKIGSGIRSMLSRNKDADDSDEWDDVLKKDDPALPPG